MGSKILSHIFRHLAFEVVAFLIERFNISAKPFLHLFPVLPSQKAQARFGNTSAAERESRITRKCAPDKKSGALFQLYKSLAEFAARMPRIQFQSIFRRHVRRKISMRRGRCRALAPTKAGNACRDEARVFPRLSKNSVL